MPTYRERVVYLFRWQWRWRVVKRLAREMAENFIEGILYVVIGPMLSVAAVVDFLRQMLITPLTMARSKQYDVDRLMDRRPNPKAPQ